MRAASTPGVYSSSPGRGRNFVAITTSSRRRAERGREELLRLATAVHLGGVEVGDALVERGVHDGA